jgi:hypothetical protein
MSFFGMPCDMKSLMTECSLYGCMKYGLIYARLWWFPHKKHFLAVPGDERKDRRPTFPKGEYLHTEMS